MGWFRRLGLEKREPSTLTWASGDRSLSIRSGWAGLLAFLDPSPLGLTAFHRSKTKPPEVGTGTPSVSLWPGALCRWNISPDAWRSAPASRPTPEPRYGSFSQPQESGTERAGDRAAAGGGRGGRGAGPGQRLTPRPDFRPASRGSPRPRQRP